TRTWTIDTTTAPDTSITSAPPASTEATSATFAFGATKSDAVFTCSIDAAAFAACTSPTTYGALAVGSHTFRVRSTDRAGNGDATPASYTWTITAPSGGGGGGGSGPDTTITGGPSGTVAGSAASFTFTSTSASATFECALD